MEAVKFIEPIINEEFHVWVAPDGTIQLTLLAPDLPTCMAVAKLWHKKGLGKSPHEMKMSGFTIQKVRVTIVPDKNIESKSSTIN